MRTRASYASPGVRTWTLEERHFSDDFDQKPRGVSGMGGPGSGRGFRWVDKRTTLDTVPRLDIRWLHRQGYLQPGARGLVTWHVGEQQNGSVRVAMADGRLVVECHYRRLGADDWEDMRQVLTLDWTACHYGGQRPWFLCPGCQRRVAVLCGAGQAFLCRHCYRLPYASQGEAVYDRLLRKRAKLRARVSARYTKPKGMHWRTWERVREQLMVVEMACDLALEAACERLQQRP